MSSIFFILKHICSSEGTLLQRRCLRGKCSLPALPGYMISACVLSPDVLKVTAAQDWPTPANTSPELLGPGIVLLPLCLKLFTTWLKDDHSAGTLQLSPKSRQPLSKLQFWHTLMLNSPTLLTLRLLEGCALCWSFKKCHPHLAQTCSKSEP